MRAGALRSTRDATFVPGPQWRPSVRPAGCLCDPHPRRSHRDYLEIDGNCGPVGVVVIDFASSCREGRAPRDRHRPPNREGPGTRSDIDYLIGPSSRSYYEGLERELPGVDAFGPILGTHNPFIGPAIRFDPGARPRFIPGAH